MVVLVCLGYNRILYTGWLIDNRSFCLTVLRLTGPVSKAVADLVSGEDSLHGSQTIFSLSPHIAEVSGEFLGFLIRALWPYTPPKRPHIF